MEKYAEIIIDIAHEKVDKPFMYRIPQRLEEEVKVGSCVNIPFGSGNTIRMGYVIGISQTPNYDKAKIKEIIEVVKGSVDAKSEQFALAAWMKENYGGTLIQALKTVLPVKSEVKHAEKKELVLKMTTQEALSVLGNSIRKKQKAKARLLEELISEKRLPKELVTQKLMISSQTIQALIREEVITEESIVAYRNPVKTYGKKELPPLSEEQSNIIERIQRDYEAGNPRTYLLHGITGSGKTNVYIYLAEQFVKKGKQAVILIPEISLTYQTLLRFYQVFGERVSVLNSGLSKGERYDQCERARKGEIDVVIGPRSALFVPFSNLGLIVIDEEHENSYKSETTPKYHARETAIEIARRKGASVLLGSATPSLESFEKAKQGEYVYMSLRKRLTGGSLPNVSIVDLRDELKQGNRSVFSRKLMELMKERLEKKEQTILFLNRRGYAGFLSCRSCGQVIKCPHCDVSLSEHKNGNLVCHYCGYTIRKMNLCPHCGSKYIFGFRAGTEQIEEKLKGLFPGVRTLRMDADTTKTRDSYERILSAFTNGEADVLVGTQMIVKGHDFPGVTLVGILAADMSLLDHDYRSGEKTFQLLTQAAGRAGRGEKPGEVVIQTYQPEHYAILAGAKQSYMDFYEEESLYRDMMAYPPYIHMLAVQVLSYDSKEGEKLSRELAAMAKQNRDVMVLGPAAAGIGKIKDVYRFVVYLKHKEYGALVRVKNEMEDKLHGMEGRKASVFFDFDPMQIM